MTGGLSKTPKVKGKCTYILPIKRFSLNEMPTNSLPSFLVDQKKDHFFFFPSKFKPHETRFRSGMSRKFSPIQAPLSNYINTYILTILSFFFSIQFSLSLSLFTVSQNTKTMSLRPNARTEVRRNRYKVAVDAEEGRRRREDNMVEIRKSRREESLLKKRREGLSSAQNQNQNQNQQQNQQLASSFNSSSTSALEKKVIQSSFSFSFFKFFYFLFFFHFLSFVIYWCRLISWDRVLA